MKKSLFQIAVIFTLNLFFSACENKTQIEIEKLNTILLDGHNQVMPKSMAIPAIKKELLDCVTNANQGLKNQALAIAKDLQKADDNMITWMEQYGMAMNEIKDENEKLAKYKTLKPQIESIKIETESSILKAKAFIALQKTNK
jgi:hypothetical protein